MLRQRLKGSNYHCFHMRKIQDVKFSCTKSVSVFLGFPIKKKSPLSKCASIGSVNLTFHIYKIAPETKSFVHDFQKLLKFNAAIDRLNSIERKNVLCLCHNLLLADN